MLALLLPRLNLWLWCIHICRKWENRPRHSLEEANVMSSTPCKNNLAPCDDDTVHLQLSHFRLKHCLYSYQKSSPKRNMHFCTTVVVRVTVVCHVNGNSVQPNASITQSGIAVGVVATTGLRGSLITKV